MFMNVLYLKEEEIRALVDVPEVIDALDHAFQAQSAGQALANPRQRLKMKGTTLHLLAGAIPGYFGFKAYTSAAGKMQFYFFLFDATSTDLISIMEADALGQVRTGAATGLATRLLALPDSTEATVFGVGWQAESQVVAMDAARSLRKIHLVSRRPEKRVEFARRLQPRVRAELVPADDPVAAVASSQILTTITTSKDPVLKGEWLMPGQHVNAAGGNLLLRRELDDAAVARADLLVADSVEQARLEAGEFLGVMESGRRNWQDVLDLKDIASGARPGRTRADQITLFKSLGLGMEDVAIGRLIYERAVQERRGRRVEV